MPDRDCSVVLKGFVILIFCLTFSIVIPTLGFIYGINDLNEYKRNNGHFFEAECNISNCNVDMYLNGEYARWQESFTYSYGTCSNTHSSLVSGVKPTCPSNIECYYLDNDGNGGCDSLSLVDTDRPGLFTPVFQLTTSSIIVLIDIALICLVLFKNTSKKKDSLEMSS